MAQYILAHDIGTSGDKATLYTTEGCYVDSVVSPYKTYYSNGCWAEQDPADWWKAVCESTAKLMEGKNPQDIMAISCSGIMLGCLFLDKEDRPLKRSIIWADVRGAEECEEFVRICGAAKVNEITGMHATANATIPKIMWVRKHWPEVFSKGALCVQAKDYITFLMTGRHVTDPTDADYYQCYDLAKRSWSGEILSALHLPESILPEIVPSTAEVGRLTEAAAKQMGLVSGIPVIAGAGDGPSACLGAGGVKAGIAVLTMGSSSGFGFMSTYNKSDPKARVPVGPGVVEGICGIGGAMRAGGTSLQWAKDTLFDKSVPINEMNRIAAESPIGANGVIFLPYLIGERSPLWNPFARGAFLNLGQGTGKADMVRAVMEGVGLHLGTIHDIVSEFGTIEQIIMNGGGTKSDLWCGIICDILGVPLKRYTQAEESTSFGAAMIAGVGAGIFKDFSCIPSMLGEYTEITPNMENHEKYEEMKVTFKQMYQALEPIYNRINVTH